MKTELTRSDLLNNVAVTLSKLEEIKKIDHQIANLYKEPISDIKKKLIEFGVNLAWIGVFAIVAFNFVGFHLLLMPILYFIFRGSKVSDRIAKSSYKKHLDANEKEIEQLLNQKAEKEYELKTLSMLESEFHNIGMLKHFKGYLETKQATTLSKCIELYGKSDSK